MGGVGVSRAPKAPLADYAIQSDRKDKKHRPSDREATIFWTQKATTFLDSLQQGFFGGLKKCTWTFFDQEKPNSQGFQVLEKLFKLFLLLVKKKQSQKSCFSKCFSKCLVVCAWFQSYVHVQQNENSRYDNTIN